MWDLIVSVPDHCLSFYFVLTESVRADGRCHPQRLSKMKSLSRSVRDPRVK